MAEPDHASTAATAKIDLFRVHFVVILISTILVLRLLYRPQPEYDLYIKTA